SRGPSRPCDSPVGSLVSQLVTYARGFGLSGACELAGGLERGFEVFARGDAELREDLVQVVLDGAGTEVELGRDLRVRVPVGRQAGDLELLRRESVAARHRAGTHGLAG